MDKKKTEDWRRSKDVANEPSDEFVEAYRYGGSPDFECDCGRTHFAADNDWFTDEEDGEKHLESLLEMSIKYPEQYHPDYESDYVNYTDINGKQFVVGCPCNGLYRYEEFIVENEEKILSFLRKKAERELEEATKAADRAWKADAARERAKRTAHL